MDHTRKILMIGNRDSGKTTYMASAYGAMKAGKYGFSVYGDQETDTWLMGLYSQISKGQYPVPTVKREQFDFQLHYYQFPVLSFQWLDYFGGVITEEKQQQLVQDIEQTDAIMLFLDASSLVKQNDSETRFREILYLISDKLADTDRRFDVIAVITKYDLVAERHHLQEVVLPLEQLETSLNLRDNIHFRIVPVSCTASGFWNVELPLLDILCSGLQEKYDRYGLAVQESQEKAAHYYRKRSTLDYVLSKLLGLKTNDQFAREYSQKAKNIQKSMHNLDNALEQLHAYRDHYKIEIPRPSGTYTPPSVKNKFRFRNL